MSFSVALDTPALEWAGSNLATVFGQKSNLLRPAFWRMLSDILRFNRRAVTDLETGRMAALTLGAYLEREGIAPSMRSMARWRSNCIWR